MREAYGELQAAGAEVLVVSFAHGETLRWHSEALELPFPVAGDPERAAYRSYGLERGSVWQIAHPLVWWRYLVLVARGRRPRRADLGADRLQLGGDFVIGPGGRLRLVHRSRRPDDRPPVAPLLAAVRATRP